jgi:hypothetical protein
MGDDRPVDARQTSGGTGRAGFRHRSLLVSAITKVYYGVLNDDSEQKGFREALNELNATVEFLVPIDDVLRAQLTGPDDAASTRLRAQVLAFPPRHIKPLLTGFIERWYLPRTRGAQDVWDSLVWWHSARLSGNDDEPLNLLILSTGWKSLVARTTISPHQPEPFIFDLTVDTPASIRARVKGVLAEVEHSMMAQIDEFEAEWIHASEWVGMPLQYRNPEMLPRVARRLYLWNVAEWTWQRIADEEVVAIGTVSQTVNNLATTLDVRVRRGAPGAPSKKRKSTILP